jgi:myo-inositol-1(or 4)-monophosphatase
MSQALHPMLNTAIKAARSAGSIINRASLDLDLLRVTTKSANDFVTEVDTKAEAIIIETLLAAYPGHGIYAEESGREHGAADSEFVWIIDPLDGTTNFIHGFPVYSVSIALAFRGQVQQAVVYDPTRNDLFFASKGRGAFLNDRRLRVSKRIRLADTLISTGFPFRKGDNFKRYMAMLEQIMPACAGLRRPGSAALDLCYVAAGYTDGFFETGLSPWDIAAGSLLVTEAGGLIGNFTGEADYLYQREVVAGSPKIYGQLVGLLKPFSRVIAADPLAGAASTVGVTPEQALMAGVAIERDPQRDPSTPTEAAAPLAPKKPATRISKETMAREKQANAEADRQTPRPRSPRGGDAPF